MTSGITKQQIFDVNEYGDGGKSGQPGFFGNPGLMRLENGTLSDTGPLAHRYRVGRFRGESGTTIRLKATGEAPTKLQAEAMRAELRNNPNLKNPQYQAGPKAGTTASSAVPPPTGSEQAEPTRPSTSTPSKATRRAGARTKPIVTLTGGNVNTILGN